MTKLSTGTSCACCKGVVWVLGFGGGGVDGEIAAEMGVGIGDG